MGLLMDEKNYKKLSTTDREQICLLINQGKSNSKIVKVFIRSRATISRGLALFRKCYEYFPCKEYKANEETSSEMGLIICL
jgi:IS30 family transposase